jgi:hypothetical protein
VHRRTIRRALASPWPPQRKTPHRRSRLDPFKDKIDAILLAELETPGKPRRTAKQIFEYLVSEHQMMGVSYGTVSHYVASRRTEPLGARARETRRKRPVLSDPKAVEMVEPNATPPSTAGVPAGS